MKETIYTIPINDAFDKNSECPVCALRTRLEEEAAEYALGAAMMEPDYRIESNAKGYCNKHYSMLFSKTNKLSLALVLDTHLEEVRKGFEAIAKNAAGPKAAKGGLFRKSSASAELAHKLCDFLQKTDGSCIVCDKIEHTMKRYIDLIVEMWATEPEFKEKFESSKGFCLPDLARLVATAEKKLNAAKFNEFLAVTLSREAEELKRIQDDIHKFTLKFDYRNKDEEWGTAKDAPVRTIEKLSGDILKFE